MIIGITGAGAMAHEVKRLAEERASGGEDISICGMYEPLGEKSISEAFGRVPDVIIDFSNPAAIYDICDYAEEQGTALVIATTGCSEAEVARIKQASESVPMTPNTAKLTPPREITV